MPNLLFLTQRLPFPPIKGEKIRQWQILNYLARSYDLHVGCLVDDPADEPHVETVRALCQSMHVGRIDRRTAKLTCTRGLLTGEPLSVTYFRDRGLRKWVEDIVERVRPELTFVISSNMAPYILDLPRTGGRIVDLVDVDSEKFRAYSEQPINPIMRLVYRREWHRVAALERRIARECDHSIFVSDAEAALFATQVPERAAQILGISNGVDHAYFSPGGDYPRAYEAGSPVFVFTGTMDYPPNVEAVSWFATAMLPAIRKSVADARFFIVGTNPTEDVKRLGAMDGVTVTGPVPDVRPYLRHATAAVAPMRVARGIQNKVLEAMSMGKPVIVTSGALEGIEAEPGTEVVLADDAESFAGAAIRLCGTNGAPSQEGAALGAAARDLILRRYDWQVRLSALAPLIRPSTEPPFPAASAREPAIAGTQS